MEHVHADLTRRIIGGAIAVHRALQIHEAQMLTYLKLLPSPVGLLMNFNVARLADGIRRVVHSDPSAPSPRPLRLGDES